MNSFNEANTVEAFLRDQLSGGIQQTAAPSGFARKGPFNFGLPISDDGFSASITPLKLANLSFWRAPS